MRKKLKIYGLLGLLALFSLSLFIQPALYAEEEPPSIELQPLERAPLEREEREFRHFKRTLRHTIEKEEERTVVKDGVNIGVDTLFEVRRPIPDLPLIIFIANATERDELLLKELKLYSPQRIPVRSFSLHQSLKPMGRDFARLRSLREEMRVLERRTLRQGRLTLAQQKERFFKIQEERARVFSRIGKESSHTRATIDLTPYLREVGNKATITVQEISIVSPNSRRKIINRCLSLFSVPQAPSLPKIDGWSRGIKNLTKAWQYVM